MGKRQKKAKGRSLSPLSVIRISFFGYSDSDIVHAQEKENRERERER